MILEITSSYKKGAGVQGRLAKSQDTIVMLHYFTDLSQMADAFCQYIPCVHLRTELLELEIDPSSLGAGAEFGDLALCETAIDRLDNKCSEPCNVNMPRSTPYLPTTANNTHLKNNPDRSILVTYSNICPIRNPPSKIQNTK